MRGNRGNKDTTVGLSIQTTRTPRVRRIVQETATVAVPLGLGPTVHGGDSRYEMTSSRCDQHKEAVFWGAVRIDLPVCVAFPT